MRESGRREWRHQLEVCDAKAARRLARERRRDSLERLLVVPAAGVDVGLDRKHHSARRAPARGCNLRGHGSVYKARIAPRGHHTCANPPYIASPGARTTVTDMRRAGLVRLRHRGVIARDRIGHPFAFEAVFEACSHAHTCHLALATRAAVPPTAAYSTLARLPSMPRGPCAKATRALTTQATPRAPRAPRATHRRASAQGPR